jgi:hypothetical protein
MEGSAIFVICDGSIVTGLYFVVFFLSFLITSYMYKNGTTVVYGGYNRISVAENIAAVLQLQDRNFMRKFSHNETDAERTLRVRPAPRSRLKTSA